MYRGTIDVATESGSDSPANFITRPPARHGHRNTLVRGGLGQAANLATGKGKPNSHIAHFRAITFCQIASRPTNLGPGTGEWRLTSQTFGGELLAVVQHGFGLD